MSQFVRDMRIALIYEGANGVQALDLVGRKLGRNGGRALMSLNQDISGFISENKDNEKLDVFMTGLGDAQKKLTEATMWLMQNGMSNPDNAGAGSVDYMHMMGLTSLAYMWSMMAVTHRKQLMRDRMKSSIRINSSQAAISCSACYPCSTRIWRKLKQAQHRYGAGSGGFLAKKSAP